MCASVNLISFSGSASIQDSSDTRLKQDSSVNCIEWQSTSCHDYRIWHHFRVPYPCFTVKVLDFKAAVTKYSKMGDRLAEIWFRWWIPWSSYYCEQFCIAVFDDKPLHSMTTWHIFAMRPRLHEIAVPTRKKDKLFATVSCFKPSSFGAV